MATTTTISSSAWFAAECARVDAIHYGTEATETKAEDTPEGWEDLSKKTTWGGLSSVILDKLIQLHQRQDSYEGQLGIASLHVSAARLNAIDEANNISHNRLNELVGSPVTRELHQSIQRHLRNRVMIVPHETSVQAPLAVWNICEFVVRIFNFLFCTAGANKAERAEKNGKEIVRCFRIIGQSLLQAIPFYGNSVIGGSKT